MTAKGTKAQRAAILAWLSAGKTITPLEAQAVPEINSIRLAARIEELRKQGHLIVTEMIELPSGKRVGQYRLLQIPQKGPNGYLSFNPDGIPEELKALSQWCCWRLQSRGEGRKPGKVPVMAISPERNASVSDPSTWTTFDRAMETYEAGKVDGVSFVVTGEDPYTILDLDDVIQADGSLSKTAMFLVKSFGSYTEVSAGGSGLHVIVKGRLTGPGVHNHLYELYGDKKVMALTGVPWGEPKDIEDRQDYVTGLEVLAKQLKAEKEIASARRSERHSPSVSTGDFPPRSDDEVLRAMAEHSPKAKSLYDGRSEHGDASSDDLALCAHLAYYCNGDREQVDRLFRQSGLMRLKWNRADYRRRTLDKALQGWR